MINICIVNLNCLEHTRKLVEDLGEQTYTNFSVTLYDQNSTEPHTSEFLDFCENQLYYDVCRFDNIMPLNMVWNSFVDKTDGDIICLLNNDIRIPSNFLFDLNHIFLQNDNIGAVMHPTNHPNYAIAKLSSNYDMVESYRYRQGWDICIRRDAWSEIPEVLKNYCGDDFIFEEIYRKGFSVAVATSSPIIHYLGQTKRNTPNIPGRNPKLDIEHYKKLGYNHYLTHPAKYTILNYYESPLRYIREEKLYD